VVGDLRRYLTPTGHPSFMPLYQCSEVQSPFKQGFVGGSHLLVNSQIKVPASSKQSRALAGSSIAEAAHNLPWIILSSGSRPSAKLRFPVTSLPATLPYALASLRGSYMSIARPPLPTPCQHLRRAASTKLPVVTRDTGAVFVLRPETVALQVGNRGTIRQRSIGTICGSASKPLAQSEKASK
jgi:hypothetical protein